MKICSGRNSAPIRCVSRRGRFPSRSGAKDGGAEPSLRPLRRRESRTAGFVFGRFWAADSVPLRIVPDCSAAPASEPAAIPVRSSVIPVRPVAFPFRGFPSCSAAGPAAVVPAALSVALLAPAVVRPCGPSLPPERQRRGTATTPLRGLRRTGSLFSSFRRIFGFRMSKLRIFRKLLPFRTETSVLLSACPASGCVPIVFFRIFVRRKTLRPTFMQKLLFAFAAACGCLGATAQPGTFSNPVIPGDLPDPSVIRVGETYYACGTSSEWAPFYPLFTSRDLVNWTQAGHLFEEQPEWTRSSFWAPGCSTATGGPTPIIRPAARATARRISAWPRPTVPKAPTRTTVRSSRWAPRPSTPSCWRTTGNSTSRGRPTVSTGDRSNCWPAAFRTTACGSRASRSACCATMRGGGWRASTG